MTFRTFHRVLALFLLPISFAQAGEVWLCQDAALPGAYYTNSPVGAEGVACTRASFEDGGVLTTLDSEHFAAQTKNNAEEIREKIKRGAREVFFTSSEVMPCPHGDNWGMCGSSSPQTRLE